MAKNIDQSLLNAAPHSPFNKKQWTHLYFYIHIFLHFNFTINMLLFFAPIDTDTRMKKKKQHGQEMGAFGSYWEYNNNGTPSDKIQYARCHSLTHSIVSVLLVYLFPLFLYDFLDELIHLKVKPMHTYSFTITLAAATAVIKPNKITNR